jgi:hypothetical protein
MAKSSSASSALSSASSAASSALSKTSKAASATLSASSKSASSAASSASAKASAAAADAAGYPPSSYSKIYTGLTVTSIIITVLALVVAGVYFSGYADDFFVYYMEKYYKGKAKAEAAALEKVGEGKAEGFLKGAYISMLPRKMLTISRPTEEEPCHGRGRVGAGPEGPGQGSELARLGRRV